MNNNIADNLYAIEVPVDDGSTFIVVHSLPLEGTGNIYEALSDWMVTTRQPTADSFCQYIFEKRKAGLTDRVAMTIWQFETAFQLKFEACFDIARLGGR